MAAINEFGALFFGGYDGTSVGRSSAIASYALNSWTTSDHSNFMKVYTTPSGSTALTEGARFEASGGFSVGNSTNNATDPGQGVIEAQNGIVVGATTASSLLNLYGSGPQIKFVNSADGDTTQYVGLTTGTTGGTGFGVWGDTGTALFVRRVDGNVGIGTTNPAALLSVGSSSQFQVSSTGVSSAGAGSTDLNGSGVPEAHCLADGTGCPGGTVYNTSGTQQTAAHTVIGANVFSGTNYTVTFSGAASFSSSSSYVCTANGVSPGSTSFITVAYTSGSSVTFTSTGVSAGTFNYICVGN